MTVVLIFLRCFEVLVSIYRSKLDYILMLEKDKSTNGLSHYTNGRIKAIYSILYGAKVLWHEGTKVQGGIGAIEPSYHEVVKH